MSESNPYQKYTAAILQRYHSGNLSEQEMHALEKAALDDPFLADALEGYKTHPEEEDALAGIREKIAGRVQSSTAIGTPKRNNTWMRWAAILILMSIAGYFIFEKEESENAVVLAKNETPVVRSTESPVPPVSQPDSKQKSFTTTTNSNELKTVAPTLPPSVAVDDRMDKETTAPTTDAVKAISTEKELPQAEVADNKMATNEDVGVSNLSTTKKDYHQPQVPLVVTGKIVDRKGEAIPGATVSNNMNRVNTDNDGKFSIAVTDTNSQTSVTALGYSEKKIPASVAKNKTIVLEESASNLESVEVISKKPTNKEMAASTTTVSAKTLSRKTAGINSVPILGWDHFQQYLSTNLKKQIIQGNEVKGKVLLSFLVNKKGKPVAIEVDISLDPAADAEAIRLLSSGPSWKFMGRNRSTVTIVF